MECQCIPTPNTQPARPPELRTTPAASDATAAPEDNDQARKTTEHGEQWGNGVDAVDPGDRARSGGATNRLNTRRNSQSKCGARRNACGSAAQAAQSDSAEHLRSRPGRAPDRNSAWRGRATYRTASPHRHRGCWPRGAAPASPSNNTLARSPPKAALGPQQPHAAGAAAEADAGAHDDRLTGWPTADQPRHALRLGLRPHAGRPDRDRGLWRRTERLSVLARAHGSRAQLGRQAREPASRGSGGPGRGAEGVGGGRRRTCARWARRSWPGKRPMEQLFRHTRFPGCWCSRSAAPLSPARPCAASACAGLLRGSAPPKPTPPHAAAIGQAEQRPHARLERLRIEAAQRGLRCSQIAAAAAVWRGAEGNGRLSAPVHSCNAKQAGYAP